MEQPVITREAQLYKVAGQLFCEKGYVATTMREIASAMGIEAASLYSYIQSKEDLLNQICFNMADQFLKALDEVNDIYFNAEEKLRMAIKYHVEIITHNQNATAVFINEWKHLPEPKLTYFKTLRDKYEQGFLDILKTGDEEDVFETVDRKFAALTILSTVNWIYHWYQPSGPMTPAEIATKLSDFILTGLKKKRPF